MLGFGGKKQDDGKLPIFVRTIQSPEALDLAHKVWQANARLVRQDPANGKEFIYFKYTNPVCAAWLEHDAGRNDAFELVLRWQAEEATEIFAVTGTARGGDDTRAKEVLQRMLTVPAVLPAETQQ